MVNLAIGKLSDEIEKLKEQLKESFNQISLLKNKKSESTQIPIQQQDDEFLKMMQVRNILKMSRNSIMKLVRDGVLKEVRVNDRSIRYIKSEVQSLMKY